MVLIYRALRCQCFLANFNVFQLKCKRCNSCTTISTALSEAIFIISKIHFLRKLVTTWIFLLVRSRICFAFWGHELKNLFACLRPEVLSNFWSYLFNYQVLNCSLKRFFYLRNKDFDSCFARSLTFLCPDTHNSVTFLNIVSCCRIRVEFLIFVVLGVSLKTFQGANFNCRHFWNLELSQA